MTDIDRQLWEIDENLMRAELNPTELGEHVVRREKLWSEREETQVNQVGSPEKPVGNKSPPKQKKGFAASTAAATGMSKTAINLAKSRTEKIPADVRDQIKGTKLDTGTYLDWLKGMDPDRAPHTAPSPLRGTGGEGKNYLKTRLRALGALWAALMGRPRHRSRRG